MVESTNKSNDDKAVNGVINIMFIDNKGIVTDKLLLSAILNGNSIEIS